MSEAQNTSGKERGFLIHTVPVVAFRISQCTRSLLFDAIVQQTQRTQLIDARAKNATAIPPCAK